MWTRALSARAKILRAPARANFSRADARSARNTNSDQILITCNSNFLKIPEIRAIAIYTFQKWKALAFPCVFEFLTQLLFLSLLTVQEMNLSFHGQWRMSRHVVVKVSFLYFCCNFFNFFVICESELFKLCACSARAERARANFLKRAPARSTRAAKIYQRAHP